MSWMQVALAVTPDNLAAMEQVLLDLGAVSVTYADAKDQPVYEPDLGTTPLWDSMRLTALFSADLNQAQLQQDIASQCQLKITQVKIEILEDKDWSREWMDSYKPMAFGQRLWVCPSWQKIEQKDAVCLMLDPGLAFGTGTHPTTALCLEWLDGQNLADKSLLDFGCGSGILAIAALLLGAPHALGTDNDPQALIASRDNAQRNNINDDCFPLYMAVDLPSLQVDICVANILSGPLQELAPTINATVKPGGAVVLSGILEQQAQAVSDCYSQWFDMAPWHVRDGWVRLDGVKRHA